MCVTGIVNFFSKLYSTGMNSGMNIACWFIEKGIEEMQYQTNLTLNKLVYFAHGFYYRIKDSPLVNIDLAPAFEAWDYGPVNTDIYYTLRGYGATRITTNVFDNTSSKIDRAYLNEFWENFSLSGYPMLFGMASEKFNDDTVKYAKKCTMILLHPDGQTMCADTSACATLNQ